MPTSKELDLIKKEINEIKNTISNSEKKLRKGIVAGVDLSVSCPGVSIINLNENKVIFRDSYKQSGTKPLWERFLEIEVWFNKIFDTFNPETIMLEKAFMSKFTAKSNMTLIKAHGYFGPIFEKRGAVVKGILPSSARAFLKIKPNNKEEAFNWISERFPELNLTNFKKENDISDSIVVALNALNPKSENI